MAAGAAPAAPVRHACASHAPRACGSHAVVPEEPGCYDTSMQEELHKDGRRDPARAGRTA